MATTAQRLIKIAEPVKIPDHNTVLDTIAGG